MKVSTFAMIALAALPAVSAGKHVRRKLEAHEAEEEEEDTRVSFVMGMESHGHGKSGEEKHHGEGDDDDGHGDGDHDHEDDPMHCLHDLLDHGLTDDQIRWIYSNYNEEQLLASGWDASALENSDGDDSTHKWSEIDEHCPDEEILISAVADTFDIHDMTFERFLKEKDIGEDHRDDIFLCDEMNDCAEYVEENPMAITFFSRSLWEEEHSDDTHPVGMLNDEMNFVVNLLDADPCIQKLASEGMSYDTLRWVYSNYDEAQLTASGWDPTSILNSDGDDSTHLWSEIDPECPAEEISLSALTDEDWRHDYVFGAIFKEKETGTEDHRDEIFLCPEEDECAEFVEGNPFGITFFTKARWEEEHSEDTLPVSTKFLPFYIDFLYPEPEAEGGDDDDKSVVNPGYGRK